MQHVWGMRKCIKDVSRKTRTVETTGRSKRRWKEKMESGACEGVDWIQLAQGRFQRLTRVNMVMNLRISYKARNFFTR